MYIPRIGCAPRKCPRRLNALSALNGIAATLMVAVLATMLIGCAGLPAGSARASEPQALLDRIWPYLPPSRQVLSEQDQEYAEDTLIQWLESYLDPAYKVVDKRFYWSDRDDIAWVPVAKSHALYNENADGRWNDAQEIEQSWRTPGTGLVRLWKLDIGGNQHYLAVAMTKYPVPGTGGRRLIGRFELQRIE